MSIKELELKERLSSSLLSSPVAPRRLCDKQVQSKCQEFLSGLLSQCSQVNLSENRHVMWHSDHDRGVFFIEILFDFLPVLPAWCAKLQQRRCLSVSLALVVIDSYEICIEQSNLFFSWLITVVHIWPIWNTAIFRHNGGYVVENRPGCS